MTTKKKHPKPMKVQLRLVTVEQLLANPAAVLKRTITGVGRGVPGIIVRGYKPIAIIQAVPKEYDVEDVYWATNPDVWKQVMSSRRRGRGVPLKDAEQKWGLRRKRK
jgi:hypothetical protein